MKRSYSGRLSIFQACAVDDSRVGAAAFRVLACLGTHSDEHGWCKPSQTLIGKRLGISRQAVSKQIKVLEGLGYIEIRPRYNQKTKAQIASWYRLILDYQLPDEFRRFLPTDDEWSEGPPQPDVAPPATSDIAPRATSRVAPPATPEVAQTSQLNDSLNDDIDPHAESLARSAWEHALTAKAIPDRDPLNRLTPVALVAGVLTLRAANSFYRDQAREKWGSTIVRGLARYGVVEVRIVAGDER